MYEIPKVTQAVAGGQRSSTNAETVAKTELIELLGLEDFLAISAIHLADFDGMSEPQVTEYLSARGIDPTAVDFPLLTQLVTHRVR
jgi:hypothetical protein